MYLSNILSLLDIWYVKNRGKVIGRGMNLTERELDVLAYVLIGEMSYQDVAEVLNINKSTVNTYMRRVMNHGYFIKLKGRDIFKNEGILKRVKGINANKRRV